MRGLFTAMLINFSVNMLADDALHSVAFDVRGMALKQGEKFEF